MRIALIGQAAFAERALEVLHARGENIVHVYAPPEVPGARPDPLKTRALAIGLPVSQPESFRTDEVFGHFKSLEADLAIMAFVTLIVPERILYAPRLKSICFHPSLLPRHRGASAINWAIIQGDAETGVTWFWPDRGIDTGPILIQRRVPIHDEDTTGSIYFKRLFPIGIDTMVEAVELIKQAMAPSVAQDERDATYEPPCRDEHARLDFDRPAREIFNLIRGCDPQPGAYCNLGAERIRLFEPALADPAAGLPSGTIISIDKAGMKIALSGASMIVKRVRLESSGKKVAPEELARAGLIAPTARLR